MKVIAEIKDLKVTTSGNNFYVAFYNGEEQTHLCFTASSERRAMNFFNKQAKCSGYIK